MAKRNYKPEEIVSKLRQADVLIAQGSKIPDVVRTLGVTQVTYYRWRREFGGLQTDQVKRMKDLELENQRLRKAVSDLTLDKLILAEAAKGSSQAPHAAAFVLTMFDVNFTSPSVVPAQCSDSIGRRTARRQRGVKTKSGSPQLSSNWLVSMGVTAIARSQRCCVMRVGSSMTSGSSGSGGARG